MRSGTRWGSLPVRPRPLPIKQASFSARDPRLIEIDGDLYPALIKDYSERGFYEETLGDFGGLRDVFVDAAEKHKLAVLLRVTRHQWEMVGLYEIHQIQSYGEPFTCRVGVRVAKLEEVATRRIRRHG